MCLVLDVVLNFLVNCVLLLVLIPACITILYYSLSITAFQRLFCTFIIFPRIILVPGKASQLLKRILKNGKWTQRKKWRKLLKKRR